MATTDDDKPVELSISIEKIRDIILKAREFELVNPSDEADLESDPDADMDRESLLDAGEDPTEAELRELIDDLNDDEIVDLIAVVWTGRGDFGRAEWLDAKALARERHAEHSSSYLMGIPTLAQYLEEGLAVLGHSPESLEG